MKNTRDLDWNDIKCFVSVARLGSLTEASKALNVPIATLARRIDRLETSLGFTLFRRGPAGSKLTELGVVMFEQIDPGARQMSQIMRMARSLTTGPPAAAIRISSTETMIADVLAPRVNDLLESYPQLRIELDVSNDLTNINAGEADIAIRLANPKSPTLLARRLAPIRLGLFCAKSYLHSRDPLSLDWRKERLLWLDDRYGEIAENVWLKEQGFTGTLALRSSSVRSLHNAALSGLGIAPLPAFSALAAGLSEVPAPVIPNRQPWLVFHRDTRANAQMKGVRDWIAACCQSTFTDPRNQN